MSPALSDTVGLPPLGADGKRLLPVDEGPRVADFAAFRARLQTTIAARDTAALIAVLHPDLKISFGGDDGIANFRTKWKLGAPDSEIWKELGAVLALGGSFAGDSIFTAPYTFSEWPDELDAYEHIVIVGRDVVLRAAPRADAEALTRISYEIVRLPPSGAPPTEYAEGWTRVQWLDRNIGYGASEFARFPLDYRAIFSRTNGVWQLVIFVAGD